MDKNKFVLFFLAVVLVLGVLMFSNDGEASHIVECWDFSSENDCTTSSNGSTCAWDSANSFCYRPTCFDGDFTNTTYCNQTLKINYNLSCGWQIYGTNLCDPNGTGGDFFGNNCADFGDDEDSCYDAEYCIWNTTNTTCQNPVGFDGSTFLGNGQNPTCGMFQDLVTCPTVTGCSVVNAQCTGLANGISCLDLNKTMCGDFTALSTCCSWNGTNCHSTFDNGCYESLQAAPIGGVFCEDYIAFKNETMCNQIAGAPWYMPCKFNNVTKECHFNSGAYGGKQNFNEIGSKQACESQGGKWKTEQWTGSDGFKNTDSWCEFNFGSGGNCDSSCWACEVGLTSSNTTTQAQTRCENSNLGYCQFTANSFALNGLGFCNPKEEFITGGGASCDEKCASCEFLVGPQAKCQGSSKGCTWVADTDSPNDLGFCYGINEKYCGNDCFSCYTRNDCSLSGKGGNGACEWDDVSLFCKTSGFTGEVCFDGKDNDNDGDTDCADANCATNKFCGGEDLGGSFGQNCPGTQNETACSAVGCVWITDDFDTQFGGANAGHCDFPGAQCWTQDENASACNAEAGCSFIDAETAFCHENETLFDGCFPQQNKTSCDLVLGCGWINDSYNNFGGRCEPLMFAQCFGNVTREINQTNCEQNITFKGVSTKICGWEANTFAPNGGFCDPICFSLAGDNATCQNSTQGLCQSVTGLCEPDSFGGKCFQFDGNQTHCDGALNASCSFFVDANVNNNVSPGNTSGWCDPKGDASFINFMGNSPPTVLATDPNEAGINDSYDIRDFVVRDDFDKFVFGTNLYGSMNKSIACNGVPTSSGAPGVGGENHTFFWYVDGDGDTTNNCAARNDASVTGFEFSFKYQARRILGVVSEVKVSYQCVNGSWGPVPIPLISSTQKMCNLIKGGMAGVSKKEMFKFKGLFNKSKDLRLYTTVGRSVSNDSQANDTAGPIFYSLGAFDFHFEDCGDSGGDADGDGITASNDPDCFDFFKYGFVPNEAGFQCGDGKDNDGDGEVDCSDQGCKYDQFICGGKLEVDPNDKKAPSLVWFNVNPFPNSAFIMYDTNEPSNGTLTFYDRDSTCNLTNATVRDVGIYDSFVPAYKNWHDAPLDAASFNPEALSSPLLNATTFFFKTKLCDISGNCAVSACLNFTTKGNLVNCKSCTSTFKFPFTPQSGQAHTDPVGYIGFTFQFPDGTNSNTNGSAASGLQFNYTQTKGFNLLIANPNSTNNWSIKLINASVNGKIASGIQNFSGGSDVTFNATANGTFVGMGNNKCQQLINTFRPSKIDLGIPGNVSELWQCTSDLSNCTQKTSNATSLGYNITRNITTWRVPAEWGC
jgi:hypothetical protein